MKFSLVSLLVLAFAAQAFGHTLRNGGIGAKGILDGVVENKLEELRKTLKDLTLPSVNIEVEHDDVGWGRLELLNLKLENFDLFRDKADTQLIPLKLKNVTLWFDNVSLKAEVYNMTGHINSSQVENEFDIFGHGKAECAIALLLVSVETVVGLEGGNIHIPEDKGLEKMEVYIEGLTCNFENIMGGGEEGDAINAWIGPFGTNVINDHVGQLLIEKRLDIIKLANKFLSGE